MKQNPLPARFRCTLTALVIIAVIVTASACATLPRSTQAVQAQERRTNGTSAININTASQSELEKLPGVGAGLAERIIVHRQQYGPFRRPEQLLMVRGISDLKFRELRPMIVVD